MGGLYVFEDFSTLRALTGPKVVRYDKVVDNTLLGHVLFPRRAWHAIVVPIGLTLWSGQLSGHSCTWSWLSFCDSKTEELGESELRV